MSILNQKSKKMLVESMRSCVREILTESIQLTAKQATDKSKFVSENATYEQLLNITLNPHRNEKYLPSYVLEGAVAILHRACLTGRHNIGVNAITEGAIKLHEETGAVITESMLDAALTSVNEGMGLKVVGKILNEAALSPQLQSALNSLVNYSANMDKNVAIDAAGIQNALRAAHIDPSVMNQIHSGMTPREIMRVLNTGLKYNEIQRLANEIKTPLSATATNAKKLARQKAINRLNSLRQGAIGKRALGITTTSSGVNTATKNAAAKLNVGGGIGKAGLIGGALALGGLGAYALNRYRKNKAAAEQE